MKGIFGYTALLSKQPRSRRCPPFSGWPLQEPRVALPWVHSFWLAGGAQVQTICLSSLGQPHPSPRCSISSSKLWPNSLTTPMHSAAKIDRTTPWCEVIYLYIRVMSGSDTNTEHLNSYSTKILTCSTWRMNSCIVAWLSTNTLDTKQRPFSIAYLISLPRYCMCLLFPAEVFLREKLGWFVCLACIHRQQFL